MTNLFGNKALGESMLLLNLGRNMVPAISPNGETSQEAIVINGDVFITCLDHRAGLYRVSSICCSSFEESAVIVGKGVLSDSVLNFFKMQKTANDSAIL